LKISLHGGNCCGVKHIYKLGTGPAFTMCARKATKMTSFGQSGGSASNDMMQSNKRGKLDFFNEAAPAETYEERFERFVKFIKIKRAKGIIEVVLNQNQSAWKPILEKHGFNLVTSGKNSNTGSTITIYHLVH
jgi:hypothetical protein